MLWFSEGFVKQTCYPGNLPLFRLRCFSLEDLFPLLGFLYLRSVRSNNLVKTVTSFSEA